MDRVISCVVGRGCLLWPVCSLSKTLLVFALLHFLLKGQTCLLLQVSLDLLFHSSPLWWKGHPFFSISVKLEWEEGKKEQNNKFLSRLWLWLWRNPECTWTTKHKQESWESKRAHLYFDEIVLDFLPTVTECSVNLHSFQSFEIMFEIPFWEP